MLGTWRVERVALLVDAGRLRDQFVTEQLVEAGHVDAQALCKLPCGADIDAVVALRIEFGVVAGIAVGSDEQIADLRRTVAAGHARVQRPCRGRLPARSEEHTSDLQSLMRISYAVFCL